MLFFSFIQLIATLSVFIVIGFFRNFIIQIHISQFLSLLFKSFSRDEISFSIRFNFSVLSSLDNVSSTDDNTDSSTSSKFSASSLNISRNAFSITPSSTALLCEQFAIPLFVAVRHFHTGFLCFISWLWKCLVRLVQQKPH